MNDKAHPVLLLPPANEVCEGYVFTRVCHSVHRGGTWAGIPQQVHPTGQVPPWESTPWAGAPPPATVHARIRSTSGRYASHWNAFLF